MQYLSQQLRINIVYTKDIRIAFKKYKSLKFDIMKKKNSLSYKYT